MKRQNKFNLAFITVTFLFLTVGCGFLKRESQTNTAVYPAENKPVNSSAAETNTNQAANPSVEKADFTVTSEELDKEFTDKTATRETLDKYASKIIQVTGRVKTLVTEKKGNVQAWVTLFAPGGYLRGVSCYFDDENVGQMKLLTKDKMATIQGFQDSFIVPKISPRLKHCIVIKGS